MTPPSARRPAPLAGLSHARALAACVAVCLALIAPSCADEPPESADATSNTNNATATSGTNSGTTSNNSGTTSTNNGTTGTNSQTSTNNGTTSTNNGTTSTNNGGTTSTNNSTTSTNNSTTGTNNGTTTEPWCDPNGAEICEDGFDNDCDGLVDEDCQCQVAEKPCYSGDPAELDAPGSTCRAGIQTCALEFYTECQDEILPGEEVCDGEDNDCDGLIDEIEGCQNTAPRAICPPDQFGPTLAFYRFEGGFEDDDGDLMARSQWRLIAKPPGSTATPAPPTALNVDMFADLQGTYVLELEVEDTNGGVGRCQTVLETSSEDALRVEMVWNVGAINDRSDLDLHLLRNPNGQWFSSASNSDDCFWDNCRVCEEEYELAPAIYEQRCRQLIADYNSDSGTSPPPQVEWTPPLDDDDPRLDLDDIQGSGPENINIKRPSNGTYRVGVHHWNDGNFGDATVTVRIYCGGNLAREFEPVVLRRPPANPGDSSSEFWEVADVVWRDGGCEVIEFGEPGCREICTRGQAEANGCPDGLTRGQPCSQP